jgi:acyl-CoA synthetase (NDP forming)
MAELSQKTFSRLQPVFPPWEIPLNPFDFGVCMQFHALEEVFRAFLDSVLNDQNVDCLAVQVRLDLIKPEQLFESYLMAKEKKKPLVTWVPDGARKNVAAIQWLESNHIPVYSSAEGAIKAISALHRYKALQRATS